MSISCRSLRCATKYILGNIRCRLVNQQNAVNNAFEKFFCCTLTSNRSLVTNYISHFVKDPTQKPQSRFYQAQAHINWKKWRFRWRVKTFHRSRLTNKPSTHRQLALRFRLTRFGWEHLRAGIHGRSKHNWSVPKYKRMMRPITVHPQYLRTLKRCLPYYTLRTRNPPRNSNPNIRKIRDVLKNNFG